MPSQKPIGGPGAAPAASVAIPLRYVCDTQVAVLRDLEHALELIAARHGVGEATLCLAVNPEKIMTQRTSETLRDALARADMPIVDGIGVSIASWLHGTGTLARVTGVDLSEHLLKWASDEALGVALYGASDDVSRRAADWILTHRPGARIVLRLDGYGDPLEAAAQIRSARPDLLLVALGSPRQELFLAEHWDTLGAGVGIGVGGTFDVLAGKVKRAPRLVRTLGLEFLFRFPIKRWRRLAIKLRFGGWILAQTIPRRMGLNGTPGTRRDGA